MINQYDRVFNKAIWEWGGESQENMAIEECSELIKAICKLRRKDSTADDFTNLIDEVADVTIMMRQMALIVGEESVNERIAYKINRLANRLNMTV
jgi:hypothetical protein